MKSKVFLHQTVLWGGILLVAACAATTSNKIDVNKASQYPQLVAQTNLMETGQISGLKINFPMYPKRAAIDSKEGCATIEYVITEDLIITDLRVIAMSEEQFAESALMSVKNASFNNFQLANTGLPVKVQTRFDFCLQELNISCKEKARTKVCLGQDTITSQGSIIKKRIIK